MTYGMEVQVSPSNFFMQSPSHNSLIYNVSLIPVLNYYPQGKRVPAFNKLILSSLHRLFLSPLSFCLLPPLYGTTFTSYTIEHPQASPPPRGSFYLKQRDAFAIHLSRIHTAKSRHYDFAWYE